jgi:hypothetical protein
MADFLIHCKVCGNQISNRAKICPHCGKRLTMATWKKVLIGIFVAFIFFSSASTAIRNLFKTEKKTSETTSGNSEVSKNSDIFFVEVAGRRFELGKNRFNADFDFIQYDFLEKNQPVVNTIYAVEQNVFIKLVFYKDNLQGPNNLMRIVEFYYDYLNSQYVLSGIIAFEFDNDAMQHQNIADRALPLGQNFIFPIISEEKRNQTRFRSYIEFQEGEMGNSKIEYAWTSDLKGVSAFKSMIKN